MAEGGWEVRGGGAGGGGQDGDRVSWMERPPGDGSRKRSVLVKTVILLVFIYKHVASLSEASMTRPLVGGVEALNAERTVRRG